MAQAEALVEAGLVRMIAALETPDDPLRDRLRGAQKPFAWRYADADILLSYSMEAGKVDLNTGDATLVRSVMRGVVTDGSQQVDLLSRWEEARRQKRVFESVASLLASQDRLSPLARELEAVFTTVTAAAGIDPLSAPIAVLEHMPRLSEGDRATLLRSRQTGALEVIRSIQERYRPLLDGERPLFRLQSSVHLSDGTRVTRSALVSQDVSTAKVSITTWVSY